MAKFDHAEDIRASVDTVWSILTDPNTWPEWFPGVQAVSGLGEFVPGANFQWQTGGQTGNGSITKVEPGHLLRVFLQEGNHKADHTFELSSHGGFLGAGGTGAHLHYTLEYHTGGGILGEFVAGGNPADMIKVKRTAEAIKEIAER